ncbi:hypothetical protein B0H10DRAFT_1940339 [Mycena sp. CBHHK59/15]|nr:hypothetical protein B0H10DRAFT_1940339 [Mycena sp. CBHHK59/15]
MAKYPFTSNTLSLLGAILSTYRINSIVLNDYPAASGGSYPSSIVDQLMRQTAVTSSAHVTTCISCLFPPTTTVQPLRPTCPGHPEPGPHGCGRVQRAGTIGVHALHVCALGKRDDAEAPRGMPEMPKLGFGARAFLCLQRLVVSVKSAGGAHTIRVAPQGPAAEALEQGLEVARVGQTYSLASSRSDGCRRKLAAFIYLFEVQKGDPKHAKAMVGPRSGVLPL